MYKELNELLRGAAAVARVEEGLRAIGRYPHAKVRRRVSDGMAYGVYLSEDQKRVWIQMVGGVAGVSAWYGPIEAEREEARRVIEAMRPEVVAEKREGGR